jgi:hypothetical protein
MPTRESADGSQHTPFSKDPEAWEGLLTEADVTNPEVPETVRRWIMVDE